MGQRVRLLLLIPRLGTGGAEHVMTLLARGLPREKYDVHLGLVSADGECRARIPTWVTVHALRAGRARAGALGLLRLVWRVRPNVVLPGAPEVSFLALLLRPLFPRKTCILARQSGTVSSLLESGGLPRYTRLLYRLLYRRADRVICQSRAMAEDLAGELGLDEDRITVLPNPVDLEGIRAAVEEPTGRGGAGPHLLAAGRLAREKGFDLLIEAFAMVRERFPNAGLTIAGAGQEEAELKGLCRSRRLEDQVRFAGQVDDLYTLFHGAAAFVLSSRYEGMPNALLEAAAAGLPLVSTPASGGIVELLRGRPGVWLAPEISVEALASTLVAALEQIQPGERFSHEFFPSMEYLAGADLQRGAE